MDGGEAAAEPAKKRPRMAFEACATQDASIDIPEAFTAYYTEQLKLPPGGLEKTLEAYKRPLPLTLRRNHCRATSQAAVQHMQKLMQGRLVEIPFLPDVGYNVEWSGGVLDDEVEEKKEEGGGGAGEVVGEAEDLDPGAKKMVTEMLFRIRKTGELAVQEAVSMIPGYLLRPAPHHNVLDLCAAPGSKTMHLLDSMNAGGGNPSGMLLANEVRTKRAERMAERCRRIPSTPLFALVSDARTFPALHIKTPWGTPKLKFDRILADVPCSGDGALRKFPEDFAKWGVKEGLVHHMLQCSILKRAIGLLAPEGLLVYSTCALNPLEGEAVIADALAMHPHIELLDLPEEIANAGLPGLSTWSVPSATFATTRRFYTTYADVPKTEHSGTSKIVKSMFPNGKDVSRCRRFLPGHGVADTGGFFVAMLRNTKMAKDKDRPLPEKEGPARAPRYPPRPYLIPPPAEELDSFCQFFGLIEGEEEAEAAGVRAFPRGDVCMMGFHKQRYTIYLASPALRTLQRKNEAFVVGAGMPLAVDMVALSKIHGEGKMRMKQAGEGSEADGKNGGEQKEAEGKKDGNEGNDMRWPTEAKWRPCHESVALLGPCATKRVLRTQRETMLDLLRARRVSVAKLEEAKVEGLEDLRVDQGYKEGGVLVGLVKEDAVDTVWLVGLLSAEELVVLAEHDVFTRHADILEGRGT